MPSENVYVCIVFITNMLEWTRKSAAINRHLIFIISIFTLQPNGIAVHLPPVNNQAHVEVNPVSLVHEEATPTEPPQVSDNPCTCRTKNKWGQTYIHTRRCETVSKSRLERKRTLAGRKERHSFLPVKNRLVEEIRQRENKKRKKPMLAERNKVALTAVSSDSDTDDDGDLPTMDDCDSDDCDESFGESDIEECF